MAEKPLDPRHYDRLLREHDSLIQQVCASFIASRPRLKDDYLQVARIAAYEALQKFDPDNGTIEACIAQYIKWRCKDFYNQSRLGAIATPKRNVGENLPQVCSMDAFENNIIAAPASEEKEQYERSAEDIKKFLDWLDKEDVRAYALLTFAGATAPEIQEKLGLDTRQRDYLQQKFKYWLSKFFDLPCSSIRTPQKPRTEEKRLSKIRSKGSGRKRNKPKRGRGQSAEPNPDRKKPIHQPRLSPWRLEQMGKEPQILRITPTTPRPSPLFEDISDWGYPV